MTTSDWLSAAGLGCVFLGALATILGFAATLWRDQERVGAFVLGLVGLGLLLGAASAVAQNWPAVLR